MFGALVDDMDAAIIASLNDGTADYAAATGIPVAAGITVIIERNLERVGADGMFIAIPLAVTWRKSALDYGARGGVFTFQRCRYVVEEIVSDDGHWITAACMESR